MGRKKKKSTRCKTSKREHKHPKRKTNPSPAVNQYQIPNGNTANLIRQKLLQQTKKSKTKKSKTIPPSPVDKIKIHRFLFGSSSNNQNKSRNSTNTDAPTLESMFKNKESDEKSKYDILKLSNLSSQVNEKIVGKIVNKLLAQNIETPNVKQISLKCISILCIGATKLAKIKLKRPTENDSNVLTKHIIKLLNGKKLFGKVLTCETAWQ